MDKKCNICGRKPETEVYDMPLCGMCAYDQVHRYLDQSLHKFKMSEMRLNRELLQMKIENLELTKRLIPYEPVEIPEDILVILKEFEYDTGRTRGLHREVSKTVKERKRVQKTVRTNKKDSRGNKKKEGGERQ